MSLKHRWSLLVAGEAALLMFLLISGLTFTHSVPLHRIQLGILATLGGIGWVVILARPRALPRLMVIAPLPLLMALAVTAVTSAYPSLTGFAVWQCAAYVGISWLLAIQAGDPTGRRNLVAVMGIVVTVVIVGYLIQVIVTWAEWLSLGFPVTSLPLRPLYSGGLVGIPAWLADVVVLCAPVVAVSLWIHRARVLAVALALAGMGAIVLSGTRSVLLLVIAAAAAAFSLLVLSKGSGRTKALSGLALVAVVGIGLGVVAMAGRSFDLGRASSYASAIDRFSESPLVGSGPGTYGVRRMSDTVDTLYNLAQPDSLNVVLTTASDSGIVGLLGLGLSVLLYGVAIGRSWHAAPGGRAVRWATTIGVLVLAGHAMGEVVFALIGVLLLLIASISIAAAPEVSLPDRVRSRPRWVAAALVAGVLVIVVSSSFVARNEITIDKLARANAAMGAAPDLALGAARDATDTSPDSVPAWWMQMVAADAAGDMADALASARQIVALEGFAQEWLSLGVLEARAGDQAAARQAIDRAMAQGPADPMVTLNAAIFYESSGAAHSAADAARQLLLQRPDIERVLRANLPTLADIVAALRRQTATDALSWGDVNTAMVIALSGEDPDLAGSLLRQIDAGDPAAAEAWSTIISAWFGDKTARADHDEIALAHPDIGQLAWSWRLAVHACDRAAADRWDRAGRIIAGGVAEPTSIGAAPGFQAPALPPRYPVVIWRMGLPDYPYVAGIWTFALDRPGCPGSSGGE